MSHSVWRLYLAWMGGTLVVAVTLCAVLNIFFDPLGIYGAPRLEGLNARKPYLDHHRELARWMNARRLCGSAAIFGNSRAEIGLDPRHIGFAENGWLAFNHAIPGSGMSLADQQLHWLIDANCAPKVVVLGVDFFDFLGGNTVPTRATHVAAPRIDLQVLSETVFSIHALGDSAKTLVMQRAPRPAMLTDRGFNPLLYYEDEVSANGHLMLFRQRAVENLRNWSKKPKRLRPAEGAASVDQLALDRFMGRAKNVSEVIHIAIYPYHAQIRLMMERAGLAELFSQWKADMLATAARHGDGGAVIRVWDFSAIGPETEEPIPAEGDKRTRMLHYWEAGHFKSALGDRMLSRMLEGKGGFGVELQRSNLAQALAADRSQSSALLLPARAGSPRAALQAEVDRLFSAPQRQP